LVHFASAIIFDDVIIKAATTVDAEVDFNIVEVFITTIVVDIVSAAVKEGPSWALAVTIKHVLLAAVTHYSCPD